MKKGDFIWSIILLGIVLFIVLPGTHEVFISATTEHPYLSGFLKFAILATMGEMLAIRITTKEWKKPVGVVYRAIVWGLTGMLITLNFKLFAGGVTDLLKIGYLPGGDSKLAFAFFTAILINLFFAPVFMAIHKCTDTYIDLRFGKKIEKPSMNDVLETTDWKSFVNFILFKTIPLFWIPAHTFTFLMPGEYRIIIAAFLSIALGGLLAFGKKNK